jgi:hypothetical protein
MLTTLAMKKPLERSFLIMLLVSLLDLASCAKNPMDALSATPERLAEVHEICAHTMALNSANADYDMCVTSLLQTLAGMSQEELLARDRRVCLSRGLEAETPEFVRCTIAANSQASRKTGG